MKHSYALLSFALGVFAGCLVMTIWALFPKGG